MGIFRRRRNWRLVVDGQPHYFKSYAEAMAAAPGAGDDYRCWTVDELVAGRRWFNRAFGYTGDTNLTKLADMGVPVHPELLLAEKIRNG